MITVERRNEILAKLSELKKSRDIECRHGAADQVLCDLLTELGFSDVVNAYGEIEVRYS